MTLIAFLPILWGLSSYVKELPLIGAVPQALVFVAVIWAAIGTAASRPRRHPAAGARVPQPARRGGLSQGTGAGRRRCRPRPAADACRACSATCGQNYFRLYLNFLYFNVVRYGYLQASVLVPYIALAPSIVAGGLTLGVMQQIIRAFGRVEGSFQYLVKSWTTIVSLISIYKRLRAFEATLRDEPLACHRGRSRAAATVERLGAARHQVA